MSTAAGDSTQDPAIQAAIGAAVQQVVDQFTELGKLSDLLWGAKAYLCASLALLGWDILSTLRSEWTYFWKKPNKITSITFAFSFMRYWALFTLVFYIPLFFKHWSASECERLHWLEPCMGIVLITVTQYLIGARVYAIWEANKLILVILGSIWATGLSLQIWAITPNTFVQLPPMIPGCIDAAADSNADTFWVFWLGPLLFDATVVALTLIQVALYWMEAGKLPLLVLILRDSLSYFIALLALNTLNVVWFRANTAVHALHGPLTLALGTALVSRMFINLRHGKPNASSTFDKSGSYQMSDRTNNSLAKATTSVQQITTFPTIPGKANSTRDSFEYV